ncbi:hypothetical protein AO070_17155 [Pseudomonas syringae pv. syringae PD2766]|uniref:STM4504/CBY_0614 family protein n=1 Tax=Pseudomonas syringae TaxID=317 RepID=UPI00073628CF|nr:hypothetical protein [Pseudomonas syringae]KTB77298.1 hypothetical protein AO070_17155 [Pseudomonas syringae pv. syringae PD2766]
MAVHDIYSKRKKRFPGQASDVYDYDSLPRKLRNQVVFILSDIVDIAFDRALSAVAYDYISKSLSREWGTVSLVPNIGMLSSKEEFQEALRDIEDTELCLDIIEFTINYTYNIAKDNPFPKAPSRTEKIETHIDELNYRLKESCVGYEFSNFQIVRIDSQLIHAEVVKPAISLLGDPLFEGPQDEFIAAHEHFRHRRYKEALNDALKAFESTIKVIAGVRDWEIKKGDTANKLVNACMDNGLFPNYYESHMSALTNLLVGGVPGIRNAEGGHGQGAVVKEIAPHTVAYTLHMTASAIVLFVQSHQALPVAPNEPIEQPKET